MARRKNDNSAAGGILYLAIIVLVYVAMIIAAIVPVMFIFGFLTNYGKVEQDKKNIVGEPSDFWLSDEEKKEFEDVYSDYSRVEDIITSANNKAIKANISKNKDGQFSARSKIGKEVRAVFERYGATFAELTSNFDAIRYLPLQRWLAFDKAIKKYKAYSYAVISYILITICYGFYLGKSSLSAMYEPYSKILNNLVSVFTDKYEEIPMDSGEVAIITVASIGSIVVFLSVYKLLPGQATAFSPIPPIVSPRNLNDF